ncbi:VOC family protein [Mycolicibacterium sp.]|uniref:VOC family protein n=1 Tax=Mycolicibacterium sp. TaxID=2320850 RepID=UPI0037CAD524
MHTTILVNLPVADIERSRKFFSDLGYSFNETFSGPAAVTVVLGENRYAMLIQRDAFDALHPVETADASKVKECVVCLGVDSREDVDALVDRALAAGGTAGDSEDHGDMYGRSFNDPDGHSWQIFWVDPVAAAADREELDVSSRG